MAILQVRSLDDQLYEALGRRAAMENRSISQEVTMMLKEFLSQPISKHKSATENFLELCGSWDDTRTEQKISLEIRKSRETDTTRFSGDIF